MLRIAQVVPDTEAEGPGKRFAIWTQGCEIHCPGCCNPEMLSKDGGTLVEAEALAARVAGTKGIEGITLLGGEPTEQAAGLAVVARRAKAAGLSVMLFSGWTLEELTAKKRADVDELVSLCDLLVDGRYDAGNPEPERRWIGSANQKIHFLSNRYSLANFTGKNTAEIRIVNGEIVVNGWPALARKVLRPGR